MDYVTKAEVELKKAKEKKKETRKVIKNYLINLYNNNLEIVLYYFHWASHNRSNYITSYYQSY